MKKIINLLLFVSLASYSQTGFNSKSLDVSLGDVSSNVYVKDSTANALVIYEKGNSFIDRNTFRLITEIEKKIKILKKGGEDYATVEIRLYNDDSKRRVEKIHKIKAVSYNLNNKRIERTFLLDKNIFRERYDKNNTFIKFTLPKVTPGTVITYSYTLESPYITKYHGWEFQDAIPKLHSEYNASIPGNYDYNMRLVGNLKLSQTNNKLIKNCLEANGGRADCSYFEYIMEDIPAFIEEDFMTSPKNYLSRIEYDLKTITYFDGVIDQVTRTWKDTDKELKSYQSLGKQLKKRNLIKDILPAQIINEENKLEQAKLIYDLVQNNYTWNEEGLRLRNSPLKELIQNKSGNVSQINLLLHNLLTENKIESKPVLVSTRANGYATKLFPVIHDFNYLIVQASIEGKTYLLDATDKYLTFGQLPLRALNRYGRLLDFKKGSSWIDIKNEEYSSVQHQVNLKFTNLSEMDGSIKSRYTNYYALNRKKEYYPNPDQYIEDFENDRDFLEVNNHEIQTKGINDIKFQESYDVSYIDTESVGDKLYLDPFICKFISTNPFRLQERTYPIDFGYKRSFIYNFELDLNNFYEVDDLPENTVVKLPNNTGEYRSIISNEANKITIVFKIQLSRAIYGASYYDVLKQLMNRIVNTQTKTLIALKKK
jgi:hypothetical protein